MTMRPNVLCLFLLFAGCATSSELVEDRLTAPEAITGVELGTVKFDVARWTLKEAKDLDKAKSHEAEWCKALGDAFLARANKRGLGSGATRTRVDITVIDLQPGSQAARYFVGMGAGEGRISAEAAPAGHGTFTMNSKITGGAWGGSFTNVMKELGTSIADHLAERGKK